MQPLSLKAAALLVVDVQQGFTVLCPNELPVPGGVEIVPAINSLMRLSWARIDASQDWHPPDHCSFLGRRDNIYPPHCVMETPGAEFVPAQAGGWILGVGNTVGRAEPGTTAGASRLGKDSVVG